VSAAWLSNLARQPYDDHSSLGHRRLSVHELLAKQWNFCRCSDKRLTFLFLIFFTIDVLFSKIKIEIEVKTHMK
jgi:hypothetical protein